MKILQKLSVVFFVLGILKVNAQNYSDSAYLEERFKQVDHILNVLREFRIVAYIQPEWQRADTAGAKSVESGNFPAAANNWFIIRRGRVRLSWQHEIITKYGDTTRITDFAFQFDATEKGFNALKDFYGKIIDTWTGWVGLKGGIFRIPFGYETPSAPATAESPEFSRVNQTMLTNECELGYEFVVESPRTFKPVYLRLDLSAVNGVGVGNTGANQTSINTGNYQSAKDFLGRIQAGKVFDLRNGTKIGINGSSSFYYGNVLQTTNNVYEVISACPKTLVLYHIKYKQMFNC